MSDKNVSLDQNLIYFIYLYFPSFHRKELQKHFINHQDFVKTENCLPSVKYWVVSLWYFLLFINRGIIYLAALFVVFCIQNTFVCFHHSHESYTDL